MRLDGELRRLYGKTRRLLGILAHKYPHRVQCNVCEWKGRCFVSDSWHPNTVCPQCGSQVRHRLLVAAISTLADLGVEKLVQGKRVLHFAPEPLFSRFFVGAAKEYRSADLFRDDVDMKLDLSNMSGVADTSFDLVIACDVLEHVPDDSAALREIHRVLTTDGWAVLTVPQADKLVATYRDETITTPEGRRQAFGQKNHLRIYGSDFDRLLRAQGFAVTVVDERNFDSSVVIKHVLFPPALSSHPLATNHRKVYFARRMGEG